MIKFFNFKPENLEKIAVVSPQCPIDNACLVQSRTGRIFQTEGTGISLVIGMKEKLAIIDCEGTIRNLIETADAAIVCFTEGCVALSNGKDYISFVFADGTSIDLTLEEFDYVKNINNGFIGEIKLPLLNIEMSYVDGKYEIDTTGAWIIDIK